MKVSVNPVSKKMCGLVWTAVKSKELIILLVLASLILGNLLMHSPLELKTTDMMYLQYQANKEAFSRDSVIYPAVWYDNSRMMRHNFARFVALINGIFSSCGYQLVFLFISAIFVLSIYLTGYQLFQHKIYGLVPCFFYYFGFIFPDMQERFHDHELNATHLAVSLVSLSLYFYVRNKKALFYAIAALIFYIRMRTAYTWGLMVAGLTIKDFFQEKDYPKILFRSLIALVIVIPVFFLTLPMLANYDFSWLPEWAQYHSKMSGPGGRSLLQLKVVYGSNGLMAGIFGVINGLLLLFYFRKKNHIDSLGVVYICSLVVGIIAGVMHDLWDIQSISKFYFLSVFSYLSLIQFYILSYLFIDSFRKKQDLYHLFTCFFMIILVPFYSDATVQIVFTILIISKFNFFQVILEKNKIRGESIVYPVGCLLLGYMGFVKEPHYISRWAEVFYAFTILSTPVILLKSKGLRTRFGVHHGRVFVSIVAFFVIMSALYGHTREVRRFNDIQHEIDVCKYLKEHTGTNAFILAPRNRINWSVYSNRLVIVPSFKANKMQFDSKKIFPEMIKRTSIFFEEGSFEKYFKMKITGRDKEATNYFNKFWLTLDKDKILRIKRDYKIDYLIREKEKPVEGLEAFYQNASYIVYRLQ